MRRFIVTTGTLVVLGLSTATAAAQERSWLSSPVAAPSKALELKVGTGYTQGFGRIAPERTLPDVGGPGLGLSLDVDYRLNPGWSVGVEGQYQELSNGLNSSARGLASNIGATYHFAPMQVGDPFVRLGSGYRLLWENDPRGTNDASAVRHGFQIASLKLGYDFRASEDIALAPIVGADLNMFVWERTSTKAWDTLASPEVATFVYAGLQGRFDLGGSRTGGPKAAPEPMPQPVVPTAAEIVTPPALPLAMTPVAPSVAVSPDIFKECSLKLDSIDHAPKFEFDKSALLPADYEVLSQIAACFTTGPMKGMRMELVGRADPRGTTEYNDALGMRRAKAVADYLEGRGLDSGLIQTTSRGERDAIGRDEVSWAIDRRVDVISR